jgi:hypothetical protein
MEALHGMLPEIMERMSTREVVELKPSFGCKEQGWGCETAPSPSENCRDRGISSEAQPSHCSRSPGRKPLVCEDISRRCTFSYYPAQPQGLLCEALLTRHWFGIEVKIPTHALDSVQRNVGENLELIYNIAAFTLFLVFTSQPQ